MEDLEFNTFLGNIATTKDYSETLYLFYIELGALSNTAKKIIIDNVSPTCSIESELKYGYLCKLYIQNIPDIVKALSRKKIAIYQIVRISKI